MLTTWASQKAYLRAKEKDFFAHFKDTLWYTFPFSMFNSSKFSKPIYPFHCERFKMDLLAIVLILNAVADIATAAAGLMGADFFLSRVITAHVAKNVFRDPSHALDMYIRMVSYVTLTLGLLRLSAGCNLMKSRQKNKSTPGDAGTRGSQYDSTYWIGASSYLLEIVWFTTEIMNESYGFSLSDLSPSCFAQTDPSQKEETMQTPLSCIIICIVMLAWMMKRGLN